jgi:hypothetical protein
MMTVHDNEGRVEFARRYTTGYERRSPSLGSTSMMKGRNEKQVVFHSYHCTTVIG